MRRRASLAELDLERDADVADVLGNAGLEPPRRPSARAPSRSRTRRCCASGHACGTGSRRTPRGAALRRHLTQAATEWDAPAGPGRALSRRPPCCGPRLDGRARCRAQRARARVRHRESRGLRAGDAASPQREPSPARAARRGRGPARGGGRGRGVRGRAARRGARRGRTAAVGPAPRCPGARGGRPGSVAAARPPGGGDRRLAADTRLPVRRAPRARPRSRDHARPARRDRLPGPPLSPDGATLASPAPAGCCSSTPGPSSRSASLSGAGRRRLRRQLLPEGSSTALTAEACLAGQGTCS